MKNFNIIKKIVFLIIISNNVYAQHLPFEDGYWMPESYVKYSNPTGDFLNKKNENFKKPITSIFIKKNEIWIRTYKSEFNSSEFKVIDSKKIYLKNVKINLATPTIKGDSIINKYVNSKFYLYTNNKNSMTLIVQKSNKIISSILFTNLINGCQIMSDDLIRFQKLLSGEFDLFESNNKILNKGLRIDCSGKIKNSNAVKSIILKNVVTIYSEPNNLFAESELYYNDIKKENVVLKIENVNTLSVYKHSQNRLGEKLFIIKAK